MKFTQDIIVSPADLSKDLKKIIRAKLLEKMTGACNPRYGYYIKIINIPDAKNGLVMEGSGDIIFKVVYTVVLMRPFKGEICDGIICKVLEEGGVHVKVGPMKVFISNDDIKEKFIFDKNNNCYVNEKNNIELREGTKVRFRYKEIQFNDNEFQPMGTMKGDYLGYIQDN